MRAHRIPIARASLVSSCIFLWVVSQVSFTNGLAQSVNSWRFFRGENYDGRSSETGIVVAWPAKSPPVLWIRDLGAGYSAFVGDSDRVYTQYQSISDQFVICID